MVGAVSQLIAPPRSVVTIAAVTAPPSPAERTPPPDPNRAVGGANQRKGPFWMEEPRWFWALASFTFLLGLILFLIAVGFDRP